MLYRCKDYEKVTRDKKFLRGRLFFVFFLIFRSCKLLPEIKEVFKFEVRKFYFLRARILLQISEPLLLS